MSLVTKSALRPNRRRAPLLLALLAVVALMGSACKQDNTPSAYNSVTQQEFIAGCTGNTSDGATGNTANASNGPTTTLASSDACQCAYNWIVLNVPYNDANKATPLTIEGVGSQTFNSDYPGKTFEGINNDVANNPNNMPEDVSSGIAGACASKGWATTTTTTSAASGGPTTLPQ
jgi:hypothetical protein